MQDFTGILWQRLIGEFICTVDLLRQYQAIACRDDIPLLSLSLTKNRRRSLQTLCQKVLKLYLAIDSSIAEIFDKSLCSKGLGLCSLESDRRGID